MRIAQVSPLFESVPPRLYGGTERIVSYLTEELVRQGHDVTLFASGDSVSTARLVAAVPEALRLAGNERDPAIFHLLELERVYQQAYRFDVIHLHVDFLAFPFMRRHRVPAVSTFHGRLDRPDLTGLGMEYRELPVVSISDAQRTPMSWLNWVGTVHHGLPRDAYRFSPEGGYLAFLGRVSPEKGLDRGIEIARRVGLPLRIAAKVDAADQEYFDTKLRPMLDSPQVEFIGEIGESEKQAFLGGAMALLFPIDWPEPFGLVMIEAMACGTPVIAFRRGSVPEVIEDGVSGFIVEDVDGAVQAVERARNLDRRSCREDFESRFTVTGMAERYLEVYERLMHRSSHRSPVGTVRV